MSTLIGPIPANWTKTRLSDICDLVPGAPTTVNNPAGTVPVLKPKNLVEGRIAGATDMMDATEARQRSRYLVKINDLLCARTGTLGRSALADGEHAGSVFGSGLICVRAKPDSSHVDPRYLASYFSHPAVSDWIVRQAKGTSIPNISSKVLGTLPVSVPPLDVQRSIARALGALDDSIEAHRRICETTAELRDVVLPLLMTGELSAGDVGEATIRLE